MNNEKTQIDLQNNWTKYKECTYEAQKKYNKTSLKTYQLKFNRQKDKHIIEHISKQNAVIPYFRSLVEHDIESKKLDVDNEIID